MFRKSIRKYEKTHVIITLDNGDGIEGFLTAAYKDHLALEAGQGITTDAEGNLLKEAPQAGLSIVPRNRILRILVQAQS